MKSGLMRPLQSARAEGFPSVYHLLHMANLLSVLEHGLLSRQEVDARGLGSKTLQPALERSLRSTPIGLPDGRSVTLNSFVPCRWFPSTPVLAALPYDWREGAYFREHQEFLVLLEVDVDPLDTAPELWFATTSPSHKQCFFIAGDRFAEIDWERLRRVPESHGDFSDPMANSEPMIGGAITPSFFRSCVVCDKLAAQRLRALGVSLTVAVRPEWFFWVLGSRVRRQERLRPRVVHWPDR